MPALSTSDAFKHLSAENMVMLSDAELQKLQNILLSILDDIDFVCKKYGISYTLGGGSCLGAVRHQGIIPWDDDLDLNFSRAEYERFIPAFRSEFAEKYWIHTPEETDNYALLSARVRLKGTRLKTRDDFWTEECGIFVDIFIIENTFDSLVPRMIHGLGCMLLGLAVSCRKFWRDRFFLLPLARKGSALRRLILVKAGIGLLLSFASVNFWTRTADRWHALCKNHASKYVSIPSGRKKFFGELYRRPDVCEVTELLYSGRMIGCPKGYEKYLTRLYGNYMRIPEVDEREHHPFWGEIIWNRK